MERHPACTAVLCSSDDVALAVLLALTRMGIRVPDDMSLVGFDNAPAALYSCPPLSTVRQPVRKLVAAVLEMLLESIESGNNEPKKVVIPSEFVARESTGAVK